MQMNPEPYYCCGKKMPIRPHSIQKGITLLELLIAVAMAGVLVAGISGVITAALNAGQSAHLQNDTLQQASFAMQRMTHAISKSRQLRLPLGENTSTAYSESVRKVLAVALDPTLDRDNDGWADANNDKDFLDVNKNGSRDVGEPERIDEDADLDQDSDGQAGIAGIDDDGDDTVDDGTGAMARHDDDEDGQSDEDVINGLDDDGDGSIDEDPFSDMNNDSKPGIAAVDDDLDGTIDEGNKDDDDEDGLVIEDWFDNQVYYQNGTTLMERLPDINATDGTQYTAYPIAENVSQLRVERVMGNDGSTVLVDITLTLSPPGGVPVTLNTRAAIGSGL
jgi:prepilin-type N-terminal cleavage/methylation domain-containing protein